MSSYQRFLLMCVHKAKAMMWHCRTKMFREHFFFYFHFFHIQFGLFVHIYVIVCGAFHIKIQLCVVLLTAFGAAKVFKRIARNNENLKQTKMKKKTK